MSDPKTSLEDRSARLQSELEALQTKRREAATAHAREVAVERELREARRMLASLEAERPKRNLLPLLERIAIASPCSARWSDMKGDDKVRFCGSCEKNVYDLSAMTRDEAEETLRTLDSPCVRFHRRSDGRVMTQDCPVGVRRKRMRLAAAIAVGTGLSTAIAGLFVVLGAEEDEPPPPPAVLVVPSATTETTAPVPTVSARPIQGGPMFEGPSVKMGRMQIRHDPPKPPATTKTIPHVR